jgi:serine/threonine-protein kinase RsbW
MQLTSAPEVLADVRTQAEAWLRSEGWSTESAYQVVLAIDEALANVIRHAYEGRRDRPIEFCLCSIDDAERGPGLEVRIRDFGRQVDPSAIRGRDLCDPRPGGLGVHMVMRKYARKRQLAHGR